MATTSSPQLTLGNIGSQQVTVDFQGGRIVTDAGLLALRQFDKQLGILAGLAERLPDPRAQRFVVHSRERLLTQLVYQILAGYEDCNDAQDLRHDPLFQILADLSPDDPQPLASGSTLARFHQAFTRRQAHRAVEQRTVTAEVEQALSQRLRLGNDYLVDLFVRTRRRPPTYVILDLDGWDDPTHGHQVLSGFHGYYDQHQYFPLTICDGATGFPLAVWLRPGTCHASTGAVDALRPLLRTLRAAWPDVLILVRGDTGFAVPELYEFCEQEGLLYALGYGSNAVLKARTAAWLTDLQVYYQWYQHREPHVQRFELLEDYQAESWGRARRIVVKLEITPQGTNRRYVVTNLSGQPGGIYHGFYVQRGSVPEHPIEELKNDLRAERLSMHRFRANGLKLLAHTLAYALVVLHREATAAVPEVATATAGTLRQRLWKVGALVVTRARRVLLRFSESWPHRDLWVRVQQALQQFVAEVQAACRAGPLPVAGLLT
jgi:DDE family transposase